MSGPLFLFFFSYTLGLLSGIWLGGRFLLYRMHHDDVNSAHANYEKRKEKYL